MINSEHSKPTPAAQEKLLKRRRFQKGSLQLRRRGKAKKWVVLYRDDGGHRRYHTLGAGSMTKTDASAKRDEFMRTVNGSGEPEIGWDSAGVAAGVHRSEIPPVSAWEVEEVNARNI